MLEIVKVVLSPVLGVLTFLWKSIGDRRQRQVAYAKDRTAAVEEFVRTSYICLDNIGSTIALWAPEAADINREAAENGYRRLRSRARESEDILAPLGQKARAAAELIDPELLQCIENAEHTGVVLLIPALARKPRQTRMRLPAWARDWRKRPIGSRACHVISSCEDQYNVAV